MTQRREFRLPDVGEGLTEADIVSWRVQPGDRVRINQIIVDIETAKAVVELPCPFEGVVAGLLVAEGQTVDVGTPIIAVDVAAEDGAAGTGEDGAAGTGEDGPGEPGTGQPGRGGPAVDPAAIAAAGPRPSAEDLVPPLPPPAADEGRQAVLVGYGVKASATTRRARKAPANGAAGAAATAAAPPAPAAARPAGWPSRRSASWPATSESTWRRWPAAGQPARSPGTTCSGPPPAPPRPPPPRRGARPGAREERIPIRGVRKHTAAAVSASAFTAPHVTEFLQVDVTATVDAVTRLRELPDFAGLRVSPLLLVARALLTAVQRHPMINSTWDEQAQEIVVKRYVNLGIAAATERGLVVPNIKDADALTLPGLARALADLAATARDGKSTPADLAGGTITITNVGVFGVDAGTPILTPPEAAILAFGQIKAAPWVVDGQLAVRQVTTLSLSFDHRIVDGDLGSAVLRDVGAMLADPLRMLAWG